MSHRPCHAANLSAKMGGQEACRNDAGQCRKYEPPSVNTIETGCVADPVEGHEGHQAAYEDRYQGLDL